MCGEICETSPMYWGWEESLAGYDTCHWLARIYCFTAFMHFILLCVRRHVRALKFSRLACMPNLYCISCVFGDWPLGDFYIRYWLAICLLPFGAVWISDRIVARAKPFWRFSTPVYILFLFSLTMSWSVYWSFYSWVLDSKQRFWGFSGLLVGLDVVGTGFDTRFCCLGLDKLAVYIYVYDVL